MDILIYDPFNWTGTFWAYRGRLFYTQKIVEHQFKLHCVYYYSLDIWCYRQQQTGVFSQVRTFSLKLKKTPKNGMPGWCLVDAWLCRRGKVWCISQHLIKQTWNIVPFCFMKWVILLDAILKLTFSWVSIQSWDALLWRTEHALMTTMSFLMRRPQKTSHWRVPSPLLQ